MTEVKKRSKVRWGAREGEKWVIVLRWWVKVDGSEQVKRQLKGGVRQCRNLRRNWWHTLTFFWAWHSTSDWLWRIVGSNGRRHGETKKLKMDIRLRSLCFCSYNSLQHAIPSENTFLNEILLVTSSPRTVTRSNNALTWNTICFKILSQVSLFFIVSPCIFQFNNG